MSTTVTCPCCGSRVEVETPLIDMNTNTVAFRGGVIHSTSQVIDLLHILEHRYPATVSDDDLIRGMHGHSEPDAALSVLRTVIHKARKIGRFIGFDIQMHYARGYRMVVKKEENDKCQS